MKFYRTLSVDIGNICLLDEIRISIIMTIKSRIMSGVVMMAVRMAISKVMKKRRSR